MEGVVFYGKGEMLSVTIKNPSLLLPYSDLVPAKPLLINSLAHRGGAHASGLPSSICFTAAGRRQAGWQGVFRGRRPLQERFYFYNGSTSQDYAMEPGFDTPI